MIRRSISTYTSRFGTRAESVLLDPKNLSARELALASALLAVLVAFVFGSNVTEGGLYVDDRWFFAFYEYAPGFFSAIEDIYESGSYGFRPLLAVQAASTYGVFGFDPTPHLIWALALAVLAAVCFYALLRTLNLERLHAGVIASLALISPAADSTKLWTTGGQTNMSVALYFAGTIATLRAFDATNRRAPLLHGVGLALYAISVLQYEVAAVAMLGSVLVYRCRVPWRPAIRRWLVDVVVIGGLMVINALLTDRDAPSLSEQVDHAQDVARNAVTLVLNGGIPDGPGWLLLSVLALAAIGAASTLVWPGWRADAAIRSQVKRWLLAAALGAFGTAAAYVIMIPAEHDPLGPGYLNRSNILAVFGISTLLYAVSVLAGTLALRFLDRWRAASTAFAVAIAVLLGLIYVDRVSEDKTDWAAAAGVQRDELERLRTTLPDDLPADSTVYSVNNQVEITEGVPGLRWWDLYGGGRLIWGPSVRTVLTPRGTMWSCDRGGLSPGFSYRLPPHTYDTAGTYGKSFVVDGERSEWTRIDNAAECREVTGALGIPDGSLK